MLRIFQNSLEALPFLFHHLRCLSIQQRARAAAAGSNSSSNHSSDEAKANTSSNNLITFANLIPPSSLSSLSIFFFNFIFQSTSAAYIVTQQRILEFFEPKSMDAHGNALRYDVELWLRLRIKAWKIDEEKLFSLSTAIWWAQKIMCVEIEDYFLQRSEPSLCSADGWIITRRCFWLQIDKAPLIN